MIFLWRTSRPSSPSWIFWAESLRPRENANGMIFIATGRSNVFFLQKKNQEKSVYVVHFPDSFVFLAVWGVNSNGHYIFSVGPEKG